MLTPVSCCIPTGWTVLRPIDRGLATELVMGVLRWRSRLDAAIAIGGSASTRANSDSEVLTALRLGVYQLRYLSSIPAHAAINESVDLVKRARKRSAVPFANAVLRKVAAAEAESPPAGGKGMRLPWRRSSLIRNGWSSAGSRVYGARTHAPRLSARSADPARRASSSMIRQIEEELKRRGNRTCAGSAALQRSHRHRWRHLSRRKRFRKVALSFRMKRRNWSPHW